MASTARRRPGMLRMVAAGLLPVPLAACATARLEQFGRFAEAGAAYAEAMDALSREAAAAAVDADSAALIVARDTVEPSQRAGVVLEHGDLLLRRVELLSDLRRHAELLRSYFLALGALAGSDAPARAGAGAEALADSLEALSARLRDARVGEAPISELAGPAVELSIAGFQRSALERELALRAPLIQRELALQQAAVEAIAAELRTDLEAFLGFRRRVEVVRPYAADARLPSAWPRRRREILTASTASSSADAAARAAGALKASFEALVEGRFGAGDFLALMADINDVLDLIELVRGTREP